MLRIKINYSNLLIDKIPGPNQGESGICRNQQNSQQDDLRMRDMMKMENKYDIIVFI